MRFPTTLVSFLYLLVSQAQHATAGPLVPKDELEKGADWIKHLFDRQAYCAGQVCGESSSYCCTGTSTCYTDAETIARCGAPTPAGGNFATTQADWAYSTTTIVITSDVLVTIVSTMSSYIGPLVTTSQNLAQSTAICTLANQQPCGALCCEYGSSCFALGKCTASATAAPTTLASAPGRPTQITGTTTITSVVSLPITTTGTFIPPSGTAAASEGSGNGTAITQTGSSGGLSPGAIAGIVIGVLAGIVILILICFCCILKTGFDVILDLLGLRSKKKETVVETEERYSRHGSASSRRDHGGWFGGGGGRSSRPVEKKKSGIGEGGILAAIALGLAGLWAVLGLRNRRKEKKAEVAASDVSYSYYSDSYSGTGTSQSSVSSPPRSQRTRDTRRTETRVTRESRRVSSRPG